MTLVASVVVTVVETMTGQPILRASREDAVVMPALVSANPVQADLVRQVLTRICDETRDAALEQANEAFAPRGM